MKRRILQKLVMVLLISCLLLVVHDTVARLNDPYTQLDLLADIRHEIVNGYVEQPDEAQMIKGAVRGMIEALDDRYTAYLTPDQTNLFEKQVHGTFSGIGAAVDIDEQQDRLVIISPLEESPAWQSGVMAGDVVLEIDGTDTKGMKIEECIKRLTGPVSTKVIIKVRHPSDEEDLITITRAQINIQTVKGFRRDADHQWIYMIDTLNRLAYVRITQFAEPTSKDLRSALDEILAQGTRGLILDLRFNAGGLLSSAVEVADLFLESDKTIVSVKGRSVAEKVYRSTEDSTVATLPLVVLANEWSASAAEIVTGALADNERAKFIGMRTFGKGSVQQYKILMNNQEQIEGGLKITNAYYYLPSGRNIHRRTSKDSNVKHDTDDQSTDWGVDPADGFFVPMTATEIKKMNKLRREQDILKERSNEAEPATITSHWIEQAIGDKQLAAAHQALLGKLEYGQWPIVGESGGELIVQQAQRTTLKAEHRRATEYLAQIERKLAQLDNPKEASNEDATVDQPTIEETVTE